MAYKTYLPYLLICSLLACCIEIDMSVPSFPELAQYFNVSDAAIQMTIAINFFGFFISSFLFGPLSEAYGRRTVMIGGTLLMLIGAMGCVLSTNLQMLYLSRFLQGIGAASGPVVAFAIIADVYKGQQSIYLIGLMNAFLTIAMAIAPVLGGYINLMWGWRGNYASVALIAFLTFVILSFFLKESLKHKTLFSFKALYKDYIFIHKKTLFIVSSLTPSLLSASYFTFIACAPFLYMETFNLGIKQYSILQGCVIGSFAVISIFSHQIIKFLGNKKSIQSSIILCLVALIITLLISIFSPQSPILFTLTMCLFSIGFAVIYPIVFACSLEIFPEKKGVVSSALMTGRALLCSLGVGVGGMIYNGTVISLTISLMFFSSVAAIGCFWLVKQEFFKEN